MKWQDFLLQIKNFKNNYASKQLRIDYGTLSTLLFAGAFDSLFPNKLGYKEILEAAEELKKACSSHAQPKEAKKNELWGIADIDSEVRLQLWRNQCLPTTKFNLAEYFKTAITALGFRHNENDIECPFKNDQFDIWLSWNKVITDPRVYRFYMQKPRAPKSPAFIGMIEEATRFFYQNGKEAVRFSLFTGQDSIPVVLWPNKQTGKIVSHLRKEIQPKQYGLAIVRLGEYNSEITASLIGWHTLRC